MKIKKTTMKTIITMLLVIVTINAQAQKKEKLPLPLYIKGGLNANNVKISNNGSISQAQGIGINGSIGLETVIPIVKYEVINRLSLNPSIMYNPTSYKPSTNFDNTTYTQIQNVRVNYLTAEFPVNYNIHWKVFRSDENKKGISPLFIGVGPYFSYALSGKYKTLGIVNNQSVYGSQKMSFGNGINNNRTTTDAGLVIKTGLDIGFIRFVLQKNIGLKNVYPKDRIVNGNVIKTRGFYSTISYAFYRGKDEGLSKKRKKSHFF